MLATHAQLLPEFQAFAVSFTVPNANSTWGMCGKHCNTLAARPLRMLLPGLPPTWEGMTDWMFSVLSLLHVAPGLA